MTAFNGGYQPARVNAALRSANVVDTDRSDQECGICHDPIEDLVVTSCSHVFCKPCLIDLSATFGQVSCLTCSIPLTVDFTSSMSHGEQVVKSIPFELLIIMLSR